MSLHKHGPCESECRGNPSVVLYSHDGYGLGHVSRTIHLAREIRTQEPGANILIVASSPAAHRVSALHDFEYIKLPSVVKTGTERYRPYRLETDLASVIDLRSELILTLLKRTRPDVLLVDHRPLGLKRELEPALNWLRHESPRTRVIVGLRDVVDEPETVVREWRAGGVYDALERLYDHVIVYGDRAVLDVTQEYAMPGSVVRKTRFVGYLGRRTGRSRDEMRRQLGLQGKRYVVVHVGGGGDGLSLLKTYLECAAALPRDVVSLVVTGPLMAAADRASLEPMIAGLPVTLTDYAEDLANHVSAADLSVSMGGYNTVCEVLSAGTPALIVPRIFPRREQYIRAHQLAARGLISLLRPFDLDAGTLAASISNILSAPPAAGGRLSLDGGARAAELICSSFGRSVQDFRRAANG